MEISEISLWYKDQGTIIELRNKNNQIVGAIYTISVDPTKLVLTATKTDEKYYLYYEGFGIYFSYWNKQIK